MQTGRIAIYTGAKEITLDNIIPILREAILEHDINSNRIQFLLDYDAGIQPIVRKNPKTYRPDIDCKCCDNVANEVTEFNLGFKWGNPITLVQNGDNEDSNLTEAIAELNSCYESQNARQKQQELARYVEIGGVGYVLIDVNTEYAAVQSMIRYLLQHQFISSREAALVMQVVTAAYDKLEPEERVHLIKSMLLTLENFS